MARDTFDRLVGAKPRLGEGGRAVDYEQIRPHVQTFNRAETLQLKNEELQRIRDLVR
jgi:hypothetical protein